MVRWSTATLRSPGGGAWAPPAEKKSARIKKTCVSDRYLSCLSVTLVYYGQTVGWISMPLGTEVGLGAGDIVLDGDPAPPTERDTSAPSTFSAPFALARSPISATAKLLLTKGGA